jgi:carboxylesterase type B
MRVVIYIHGGGLEVGARNQRFNSARRIHRLKMLRNDTVWINIGYSLGPLGFWHHTDENGQVHSNVALHEIILALKWVQDHIHQFGGDPENVTLVGYSGGAALAHLVHIILKDFHSYDFQFAPFIKLILMSGSALLFEPVFTEDALMRQAKIMSAAGCSDIACLQHLGPQQLAQAIVTAQVMCSPIIDNQLLFEKTELYLQSGHFFPGVTIMLTAAANECSPFCFINEKKVTEIGHGLWSELGHDHLVESIQAHYQPQFASPLHSVTKAMSDAVFIGPARRIAKLYRQHGIMVYEHEFDFVLDRLNSPILNSIATTLNRFTPCSYVEAFLSFQQLGTFHGLDQAVLFDTAISKKGRWTVASLCSKEQAEVILSPVLKFICTGEAPNSVPLRVHGPPVDRVNVRKMVAHLYCRPQDE